MAKKKKRNHQPANLGVLAILCVAILAVTYLAQSLIPSQEGTRAAAAGDSTRSGVVISELMSANASAIADDKGKYSDWFEITNTGSKAVDLTGWTVALSSKPTSPFTFSEKVIQPGEVLLIYASGSAQTRAGYVYHAPFKLPASGGVTLVLGDSAGQTVDSVELPTLQKNESYVRGTGGSWETAFQYTPGLSNTEANYQLLMASRGAVDDPVELSEIMTKNASYVVNEYGEYVDWIELHNTSDKAVSLAGYSLSDSSAKLNKWTFPAGAEIPAKGYLVVYADGKGTSSAGRYHLSFKLSHGGEDVYLSNPDGAIVDHVTVGVLSSDQVCARVYGEWTDTFVPTPGYPNDEVGAAQADNDFRSTNTFGLYISELMTSTNETAVSDGSYDWVELYNSTNAPIDLTGFGLSDKSSNPRRWQFPSGASIGAGQYMVVFLSGLNERVKSNYHTSFKASVDGGYTFTLCDPQGSIIDRLSVPEQMQNVSYGRLPGWNGLGFFTVPTAGSSNSSSYFDGRCARPTFSVEGGLFDAGDTVTITLSAARGAAIYYTTDCTDPNTGSNLYTGPITVSSNTIIRAMAVKSGMLDSLVNTQSYFFGLTHTMRVVSLVSDPANLFDYYTGMYEKGPNATSEHPYGHMNYGANFWMDWEKPANVEIFGLNGEVILSDPCGIKLHGQYSRAEAQKAFKVIARKKYGTDLFHASLFSQRPYTEYQSFLLRASGQDSDKTRMRDSVLTDLAEGTGVMYQATELCVVYINGQYWGQYNMRERINTYSICQWEGWDVSIRDQLDLVKANRNAMQGSNKDFETIIAWIKEHGLQSQENLDYVDQYIDIDNYLNYIAVEMFIANPDLLNVKRYKCDETDGRWRWVLFDVDWAFIHNSNSISRWLNPKGMGTDLKTDNTLFVELMKSPIIQDRFLTLMGQLMATNFSTEHVLSLIDARYEALLPEMPAHQERWGLTMAKWESEMKILRDYAQSRPGLLLGYFQEHYKFSADEMEHYFGEAMEKAGYTP